MLSGKALPSYETLAEYCFFTATGKPFEAKKLDKKNRYIGSTDEYDVYLFYEPDVAKLKSNDTALTFNWVEQQPKQPPPNPRLGKAGERQKTKLVFAPVRYVGQETLSEYDIEFCQLPWEIYRKLEGKE
jgi:adenine-specific DNA-methyltransferase